MVGQECAKSPLGWMPTQLSHSMAEFTAAVTVELNIIREDLHVVRIKERSKVSHFFTLVRRLISK